MSTPVAHPVSNTAPARSRFLARGVSSAARLRARPLVLRSAHDARVVDVDGREYADFVLGMGPILLGHSRPEILDRVQTRMRQGALYGTTEQEFELAETLCRVLPHAETVAFSNTGSEATHLALRLARAGTGRRLIVKFEGHYHGWIDPLFANTQMNDATRTADFPVPGQHSVRGQASSADVLVIRWNDVDELRQVFSDHPGEIAGVIVEPIPMNFGTLMPDAEFAAELRSITARDGARLIFDEVLSGFRLALGGAAEILGVSPDLAVYAKAIANGFPLAAVAGTLEAMDPIINGPMLPAGTYSGNPISVEASLAALDILQDDRTEMYPRLDHLGSRLAQQIRAIADETGAPLSVNQIGSVLQMFWGVDKTIRAYADADTSDRATMSRLSEGLLDKGSLVSGRGLILLSAMHTEADIDALAAALRDGVDEITKEN